MRNKKLTYVLLPLVALLWGYIFYKIFWGTRSTPNYKVQQVRITDSLVTEQKTMDYKLLANYSDPFLKNHYARKNTVKKTEERKVPTRQNLSRRRRTVTTKWPNIKFGGIITNEESEKITILVEIDKLKCLMNVGDIRKGVEVKQYYPDSIIVVYKGEQKTIPKLSIP